MLFPRISKRTSGNDDIWPGKASPNISRLILFKGRMKFTSFNSSFKKDCVTNFFFNGFFLQGRGKSWGWGEGGSVFQWKRSNDRTGTLPDYKLNTAVLKTNCIIFPWVFFPPIDNLLPSTWLHCFAQVKCDFSENQTWVTFQVRRNGTGCKGINISSGLCSALVLAFLNGALYQAAFSYIIKQQL